MSTCQLSLVWVACVDCEERSLSVEESAVACVAEVPLTEAILAEWKWLYLLRIRCEPLLLISGVRVDQVSEFDWEFECGW